MRRWTVITAVLGVMLMAASFYPSRSDAQGDDLVRFGDDFSDSVRPERRATSRMRRGRSRD